LSVTDVTQVPPGSLESPALCWLAAWDPRGDSAEALVLEAEGDSGARVAVDGPYRVVFDGRLYNRDRLRELGGAPTHANDAEVILHTYRALGADTLARIEGLFVLIIWDGAREQLVCARDPVGRLPLFYATSGDTLIFSMGFEDLVRQPHVSAELNRVALAEHLAGRWPDPEDTYYAAVRRVPAGHALVLGRQGRRLYRYWDPIPTADADDWVGEDEIDRFEELFDQAVGRCLDGDPAGVFLSGGLDSVSVAAVATDLSRKRGLSPPWALSLAFPHRDCNEEEVQRGVAGELGIPQVLLGYDNAVAPLGRVEAALEGSQHMPMPLIGIWPPAYWRLSAEGKRRGCKVILTGGGGDEMLLPSHYLAADLLARFDFRGWWRLFRELRRSYPWSTPRMIQSTLWRFGARPLLQRATRRAVGSVAPSALERRWRRQIEQGTPSWVSPDPAVAQEMAERAFTLVTEWPPSSDFYYHECRAALDHVTVSLEMERLFEEGRRTGIPIMEPFWDAELQAFLYRVPPDVLNQGGRTKGLVRGMLARRFPELGFERQKKVIATSFATDTFVSELPKSFEEMGGAQTLSELGIVDPARIDEAVTRMVSDPRERRTSNWLWHLLSLEVWVRARV
jgi:asparagine synthase (glutamine-hydrolysing)